MPHMLDFGPVYVETDLTRFPVEPWNTCSNFLFLFVFLYWGRRTRFSFSQYPSLVTALPVLLLGFVGGTLYHATRSDRLWLVLDFMSIYILALYAALILWFMALKSFPKACAALILMVGLAFHLKSNLAFVQAYRISLGYCVLALTILVPALWHCKCNRGRHFSTLLGAFSAFAAAVIFRQVDQTPLGRWLPMGTHFLWHALGALSAFLLINYIYLASVPQRRNFEILRSRRIFVVE